MIEGERHEILQQPVLPPADIDMRTITPYDGILIDPVRVTEFAKAWRDADYPEGILITLLGNLRHIKEPDFAAASVRMADAIAMEYTGRDIILCSSDIKYSSGQLMMDTIRPLLEKRHIKPVGEYDIRRSASMGGSPLPSPLIENAIANRHAFVYIDDGAYSQHGQLYVSTQNLIKRGISGENISAFVIGSTTISRQHASPLIHSMWSYYQFPTLAEIFSSDEYKTLSRMPRPGTDMYVKASHPNAVLTSFFFTVPDQHYDMVVRFNSRFPYILNNEKAGPWSIYPKYRDSSYYGLAAAESYTKPISV